MRYAYPTRNHYSNTSVIPEPSPTDSMNGSAKAPSNSNNGNNGSNGVFKVVISNLPSSVCFEELEGVLAPYGVTQNFEKLSTKDGPTQVVQVSFETAELAQQAVSELNNSEYQGHKIKVEAMSDRRPRGPGGARGIRGNPQFGTTTRPTDFPLRILVPSDMVGAIIGRQGTTIRHITQQTRARVDVHRKDNIGALEKAITIFGNPENCTNACKKILEVMQQEAMNTSKSEITLKMLAHNNLIGRIIGKGGNTIKRIMQDTETKIAVSSHVPNLNVGVFQFHSITDLNNYNMERIITVKGNIDNMSKAESLISAKLRQSFENDIQSMPQSVMFPGIAPMTMMATSGIGYPARSAPANYQAQLYGTTPAPYPPMYQPPPQPYGVQATDTQETVYLYIPNQAVGAIIGTRGSQIRNMIRCSNASIKIASVENEKQQEANERKVTIVGNAESQWKAQYMIFEKMREEGFSAGLEELRMTVEILVPSAQVGRIIGRGGQNVRELQRLTGSQIKLPEHVPNSTPSADEETTVHIIGPFLSIQSAQRRIRQMITGPVRPRPPRSGGAGGSGNLPGTPGSLEQQQ